MMNKSVAYDRLVVLLIEAIKEQQSLIDSLGKEVKLIKEKLEEK